MPTPIATNSAAMSQNRTTTVISAQPLSSKWWCSGLIRKIRRPCPYRHRVSLNHALLQDHRPRDDEEQAADEHEQQLRTGEDREGGEGAAEAERAGVAHEDLGGRGVAPEEADERAGDGRGDDREVEGVADVVA